MSDVKGNLLFSSRVQGLLSPLHVYVITTKYKDGIHSRAPEHTCRSRPPDQNSGSYISFQTSGSGGQRREPGFDPQPNVKV